MTEYDPSLRESLVVRLCKINRPQSMRAHNKQLSLNRLMYASVLCKGPVKWYVKSCKNNQTKNGWIYAQIGCFLHILNKGIKVF